MRSRQTLHPPILTPRIEAGAGGEYYFLRNMGYFGKTTELDQAVQEAEDGRVSGPFNSAEELFKHLGI